MHQKRILVLSRQSGFMERFVRLAQDMDARCEMGESPLCDLLDGRFPVNFDLIAADADINDVESLPDLENAALDVDEFALLLVLDRDLMEGLRLPVQIASDFCDRDASDEELSARLRHLLWPGEEATSSDFIRQGSLTINLATYQVKIDGVPVDFTYLEYALLAFLVTHPGRTYSRDALLNRVWDFDYYGGSRTVDVHVRRIRAKLGPDLAQHLKTVRGVGYLWSF